MDNYTEDVFQGGHNAQSDLQNMENNFTTLRTSFSNAISPNSATLVDGQWWLDTTDNLLKFRKDGGWIVVFNLANYNVITDQITEKTTDSGVTIDGVLFKDDNMIVPSGGQIKTDIINEKIIGNGVTIDGLLIKDGTLPASSLDDDSLTIEKIQHGSVMLPFTYKDILSSSITGWVTVYTFGPRIYIPADATSIKMSCQLYSNAYYTVYGRFGVGSLDSTAPSVLGTTPTWVTAALDVSSLDGWYSLTLDLNKTSGTSYMKYVSFIWE